MKNVFCTFVLLAFAISSIANRTSDTVELCKIKSMTRNFILSHNYDSAMFYSKKGLFLANKHKNYFYQAKFLSYKALTYRRLDKYDSALHYNELCKNLRLKLNDEKGLSATYMNLGSIYQETGNYYEAKKYYAKALELKEKLGEAKLQIDINNNYGLILIQEGKYREANSYFEKAISKSKLLQDTLRIANSLTNLGTNYSRVENFEASDFYYEEALELYNSIKLYDQSINCYINLARNLSLRNHNDEAFKKYQIAIELAEEKGTSKQLAAIYSNMASMLIEFENYPKALEYSKHALELNEKIDRKTGMTSAEINMARSYLHLGKYDLAENRLNSALKRVIKINDRINEGYVYKILSSLYYKMGKYKHAYDFREKFEALEDSILNVQVASQIEGFRIKYESTEKEHKIEQLSKEKEIGDLKIQQRTYLAIISAFTALLIFFLALLLIRQNKQRAKRQEISLKQKLLRTQMNPHFIFNALGSIQNYIFANKNLEAGKYLSKFANLMRNILENSVNEMIPIEQEIETIENYLLLQKLRKKGIFNYIVLNDVKEDINIPPMLAQPFIENSINHAFEGLNIEGYIDVRYFETGDYIKIEIKDNGMGVKKSTKINQNIHKSKAIGLTTERLKLISRKKINSSIKITDLSELGARGTLIEIKIPKEICLKY